MKVHIPCTMYEEDGSETIILLGNESHPLYETTSLTVPEHPECLKDRQWMSFLPAAVRLLTVKQILLIFIPTTETVQ